MQGKGRQKEEENMTDNMVPIRLVVSDIDGTLVQGREGLPEEIKQVVGELKKRGILFTFASGRLPSRIDPYLQELSIQDVPVCACNGTLLYQGSRILESHPLRLSGLRPLIEAALSRDMTVLYASGGTEYCMQENESTKRKLRERGYYHKIRPLQEREWETLLADKVNILDERGRAGELLPWEREISSWCSVTHYGSFGLELVQAGYGKEYGLLRISEWLKIPREAILAVGDNENDDNMLRMAGIGGAVGNAVSATKRCADLVAERAGGAGAAEIIRRVCLGGKA